MIGHLVGAAGGIEAEVSANVVKDGIVPPTINLENPDLEAGCDLDYVPKVKYEFAKDKMPRAAISDNLGFGGHNAAIAFKAYPQK